MNVIYQDDRNSQKVYQHEHGYVVVVRISAYSFDTFAEVYAFLQGEEHGKKFYELANRYIEETGRETDHESIRNLIGAELLQIKKANGWMSNEEIMIFETADHKYLILGENDMKLLCTLEECRAYLIAKRMTHKDDHKPFKNISQEEQKRLSITALHRLAHRSTTVCKIMIDEKPIYAALHSDNGRYFDTLEELTAYLWGCQTITYQKRKKIMKGEE